MASSAVTLTKSPNKHVAVIPSVASRHIRWVDFDNGDDDKDGLTRQTAWKTIHGHTKGNGGFWSGSPDTIEDYFHGGQIGPSYEYRLRGRCTDQIVTIQTSPWDTDDHDFTMSLSGTKEHPIVFTSWDVVHDRAILAGNYCIETTSDITYFETGHGNWDDHYDKYIGIDFQLDGQNDVLYGNGTSFIDCTFVPSPDTDNEQASILVYGDWLLIDRCLFRSCNEESLLYYGVYITIQNSIFHGLNFNGTDIDRNSSDIQTNSGYDWIWLIYLQDSPPPFDQRDAIWIINNTIVGYGGLNQSIDAIGLIYEGYVSESGRYHGVIIRNNIWADIGSTDSPDNYIGPWYIDPVLAPIKIDHNLISNDVFNLPEEVWYRNEFVAPDFGDGNITFDDDTDLKFVAPKFYNKRNGNYRLQNSSLAINAGSIIHAPDHDFRGFRRTGNPDIGAFEAHGIPN